MWGFPAANSVTLWAIQFISVKKRNARVAVSTTTYLQTARIWEDVITANQTDIKFTNAILTNARHAATTDTMEATAKIEDGIHLQEKNVDESGIHLFCI